jgi:beta-glucanase (GH16 family)
MTHRITLNNVQTRISKTVFLARAVGSYAALVALLFAGEMHAANILTNSGFETASLAGWTPFGANNYSQSGAGVAHGGVNYCKVYGQFNGATNYTGIYQDNPSAPGAIYSADGWAYSLSSDYIRGQDLIWLEVSFRDASYNTLALYRSVVVSSNNIASYGGLNTWFDLQITNQCSFTNASKLILSPGTVTNAVTSLVAPSGTVYARYQIVFEQGKDNASGSIYFDDLTLNQTGGTVVVSPVTQWNIVWSDEFNGTSIDTSKWAFETGNNNGWGNSEREYYTGRTNNAYVSNGILHIVARQESTNGFSYTSARMKTENLYTTTYGRVEWRAKLPAGVGMWPALWMLGANIGPVGWPGCGEIDVVETKGTAPATVQSSLHSGSDETGTYIFSGGDSSTNFHNYLLDWEPNSISFSVDGHLYETQTSWGTSISGATYPTPFNAPFFILMNLAVGGNYVGNPSISAINAGTIFPAEVQVDYVRVYERTVPLQISATQSNGNFVLICPTNIVCHLQAQTNSLVGANWFDVSNPTNLFVIVPDPNNVSVFFRLESP